LPRRCRPGTRVGTDVVLMEPGREAPRREHLAALDVERVHERLVLTRLARRLDEDVLELGG
jgi:hypothetical protein